MRSRLQVISLSIGVRGVVVAITDRANIFLRIASTQSGTKLTGRLSHHASTQIDKIYELFLSSLRQLDKVFQIRLPASNRGFNPRTASNRISRYPRDRF